jgi:hypothetical protein
VHSNYGPVGVLDPKLRKELVGVFDVLDEPVVGVRAFLDRQYDSSARSEVSLGAQIVSKSQANIRGTNITRTDLLSEISEPGVVGTSPSAL